MRLALRCSSFGLMLCGLLAPACSSNPDSTPNSAGTDNPPLIPQKNGVRMSESDACDALQGAYQQAVPSLQCTATAASCPDFIRAKVEGAVPCLQYDQGTIQGCAEYYATYASCSDLDCRPCEIAYFQSSAPDGCPQADAGAEDASEAATEAGRDAPADASDESEAAPDLDALPEAETEAGAEASTD